MAHRKTRKRSRLSTPQRILREKQHAKIQELREEAAAAARTRAESILAAAARANAVNENAVRSSRNRGLTSRGRPPNAPKPFDFEMWLTAAQRKKTSDPNAAAYHFNSLKRKLQNYIDAFYTRGETEEAERLVAIRNRFHSLRRSRHL
jgi:hypothetical protein